MLHGVSKYDLYIFANFSENLRLQLVPCMLHLKARRFSETLAPNCRNSGRRHPKYNNFMNLNGSE
jgi:hypothetical protein